MRFIWIPILIIIIVFNLMNLKPKNKTGFECKDCNLIIISLTNLRKDNLNLYGYKTNTSPNINRFFENSIKFENALAPASLTFTDLISLFYSLHPVKHNFMNRNDRDKVMPFIKQNLSLPRVLKDNGYETAAFVSDEDYSYDNGLGDQFDLYFDKKYYENYGILFKPWQYNVGTKDLVGPSIKWLDENKNKKFFLFLQAYDVHCPYNPESKFINSELEKKSNKKIDFSSCFITLDSVKKNKSYYELYDWHEFLNKKDQKPIPFRQEDINFLISRYDSEIMQADYYLNKLFVKIKELDLDKKTIIIFMSEHGDYLGENGYFMKAAVSAEGNLHNSNLGFPLLMKLPKLEKSLQFKEIFQTIDLAPTLLSLLNLEIPKKMQGKSHSDAIFKNEKLNEFAFASASRKRDFISNGIFISEALQNNRWKLTRFEHQEFNKKTLKLEYKLFDLENDKMELTNKADDEKTMRDRLIISLEKEREYYKK